MNADPLVAEVTRGSIVESVHIADLAIVDDRGVVTASAGDPLAHAAFRSSAKPLQAGVCLENGWRPAAQEHLALACASHNGEPRHVEVATAMLRAAGLGIDALRTPAALPDPSVPEAVAAAGAPAAVYHNCSGKHAAMLATCVERGWPTESYREPGHPLQQSIHDVIESLAGTLLDATVDGCGVVTYAAPLPALARAFAAVRATEPFASAAAAMRAHPWLVGGSGRLCTDVMSGLPGVTAKVGAEGLVCAAWSEGALAVKVRDGARRAQGPFLLESLRIAGVLPDSVPETLECHLRVPVAGGERPVGEIRIRPARA